MIDYPSIKEYIISDEPVEILSVEMEREINEFMEELYRRRLIESCKAMNDAKNIVLNC
jgi:ABC-type Na+ transport system ATPase subunit NatA